jgi:hypothetical protein
MNRVNRWMAGARTLLCASCFMAGGCTVATGAPDDTGASQVVGAFTAAIPSAQAGNSGAADGGYGSTSTASGPGRDRGAGVSGPINPPMKQ